MQEIARVVTRSGAVVLLWNRPRWSESDLPWLEEFRELVQPYRAAAGDLPAGGDDWQEPFDASRLFGARSSSTFEHVQHLSPDAFVALLASWSWIANLPGVTRNALRAHVRELIGAQPRLTLRYITEVQWARRR